MLISNKKIIASVSTHARIEIYTNAKENDLKNENNRFFVKFESNTFSFYVELKYITDQYDQLAKVQGIYTFLFLATLIFFKPKKSLYSISEWMILQAFAFVIVSSWLLIRVSLEKIDTRLRWVGLCAFINICLSFFFLRNYE
jgi:asparagine N-glycosylation enzyme membrane subunit Stt3